MYPYHPSQQVAARKEAVQLKTQRDIAVGVNKQRERAVAQAAIPVWLAVALFLMLTVTRCSTTVISAPSSIATFLRVVRLAKDACMSPLREMDYCPVPTN